MRRRLIDAASEGAFVLGVLAAVSYCVGWVLLMLAVRMGWIG